MFFNFKFLDRLLFELSCKNTETQKHENTHTDSDEYSIVALCKNATITSTITDARHQEVLPSANRISV